MRAFLKTKSSNLYYSYGESIFVIKMSPNQSKIKETKKKDIENNSELVAFELFISNPESLKSFLENDIILSTEFDKLNVGFFVSKLSSDNEFLAKTFIESQGPANITTIEDVVNSERKRIYIPDYAIDLNSLSQIKYSERSLKIYYALILTKKLADLRRLETGDFASIEALAGDDFIDFSDQQDFNELLKLFDYEIIAEISKKNIEEISEAGLLVRSLEDFNKELHFSEAILKRSPAYKENGFDK